MKVEKKKITETNFCKVSNYYMKNNEIEILLFDHNTHIINKLKQSNKNN